MTAANHNLRVMIWDLGPLPPKMPERPVMPNVKPDTPEAMLAESDFKASLSVYEHDRDTFAVQKRAFDDWHRNNGGPFEIQMWSLDAADALARDPKRYSKTLPKGKKPGRTQRDNLQRREQEQADLDVARSRDPQFGERGAAA